MGHYPGNQSPTPHAPTPIIPAAPCPQKTGEPLDRPPHILSERGLGSSRAAESLTDLIKTKPCLERLRQGRRRRWRPRGSPERQPGAPEQCVWLKHAQTLCGRLSSFFCCRPDPKACMSRPISKKRAQAAQLCPPPSLRALPAVQGCFCTLLFRPNSWSRVLPVFLQRLRTPCQGTMACT